MRKFFLLLLVQYSAQSSYGQLIDPQAGLKLDKNVIKVKTIIKEIIPSKEKPEVMDTITTETETKVSINSRVAFYGLTSLNNSGPDLINSLNGTGRLGIMLFPSLKHNFKINMGINMINANPPNAVSRDSLDFNSLMFPETGNFGFMFSPSVRIGNPLKKDPDHSLWLESSFAYRKVSVSDPAISFKTLSYNVGFKYQWQYEVNDSNNLIFSVMPYFNYFNVPNEDVLKFKSLLNDPLFDKVNNGAEIPSIGFKTTVQFKNFMFFFDIRNNMKTKEFDDGNPLKGTKVNIGFASAFALKSF